MSISTPSSTSTEATLGHVDWRPRDDYHALLLHECGLPLVEPTTGEILVPAAIREELWPEAARILA